MNKRLAEAYEDGLGSTPDEPLAPAPGRHQHAGEVAQETGNLENARKQFQLASVLSTQNCQARLASACKGIERESRRLALRQATWLVAGVIIVLIASGLLFNAARSGRMAGDAENPTSFVAWLAIFQLEQLLDWRRSELATGGQASLPDSQPLSREEMLDAVLRGRVPAVAAAQGASAKRTQQEEDNQPAEPFTADWIPNGSAGVVYRPEDVPTAEGPARNGALGILITAVTYHAGNNDSAAVAKLIETFGKRHGWRAKEAHAKGLCEVWATEACVAEQEWDRAEIHAGRAVAAGIQNACNAYLWLCRIRARRPEFDLVGAREAWRVGTGALDYIERNRNYNVEYLASMHRAFGASAWMYFNDAEDYLTHSDQALELLEKAKASESARGWTNEKFRGLEGSILADRLEFCLIANRLAEFDRTIAQLKGNGTLSDSRWTLVYGLSVMRLVLEGRRHEAAAVMTRQVVARYTELDEYVASWDWVALRKHLQQQSGGEIDATDAETLTMLINTLENGKTAEKLNLMHLVIRRLRDGASASPVEQE